METAFVNLVLLGPSVKKILTTALKILVQIIRRVLMVLTNFHALAQVKLLEIFVK